MAIVRYTLKEIKKMPSQTDWERINNMKDEDVDCSDCPEMTDEMLATATRPGVMTDALFAQMKREDEAIRAARTHAAPEPQKVPVTFYVAPAILASFRKKSGKNWQSRLNSGAETWLRQAAMA
jgi:uncharacterized protein (DUF4415 family)